MKTYVKPALTAFSLAGNENLCGGCAGDTALEKDPALASGIMLGLGIPDADGSGGPSRQDFISYFANSEDQCVNKTVLDAYCKFSSGTIVLWS